MINLIIGEKGSGKTKKLVDFSNQLISKSIGDVVFIANGKNLNFDLPHKVRLINIDNYNISDFSELYGFICGICAGNYDLTDILIDSIYEDISDDLNYIIKRFNYICKKFNVNLMMCLPIQKSALSQEVLDVVEIK